MNSWKTIDSRTVLDLSPRLVVQLHTVQLPDGQTIPDWSWIITPDYVNVLAVTDAGLFLCFTQTKYAFQGTSLAPIGGYVSSGENPLDAAKRELLEEAGYSSDEWLGLGSFCVDGNRGAGNAHLFLATNCHCVQEPSEPDLEEQVLRLLPRREVASALLAGQFKALSWSATVALALLHSSESLSTQQRTCTPNPKDLP